MKKLFAILLAAMMMLSLAACGTPSGNEGGGGTGGGNANAGEVDSYEKLKLPEGWDNYSTHASIDDVWDTSVLPEILPGPIDGMTAVETVYKDKVHTKYEFSVGRLGFEKSEDFRVWEVSFTATQAQFDDYLEALDTKGFVGALDTDESEDDRSVYSFSNKAGYYACVRFGSFNDSEEEVRKGYITITDSLYDRPVSVSGIPLPEFGVATVDYSEKGYIDVWDNSVDDYVSDDFDWFKDSFPTDLPEGNYFELSISYFGGNLELAKEYTSKIASLGWEMVSDFSEHSDCSTYKKDGIYLEVFVDDGHEITVWFGDYHETYS